MSRAIISGVLGSILLAGAASAQTATVTVGMSPAASTTTPSAATGATATTTTTVTPSTTTSSSDGAFSKLSPGNQTIAKALFAAQSPSAGSKALTLDQIAARKEAGQGFGQIFHEMREDHLTNERSLGDVVSDFRHQQIEERHEARLGGDRDDRRFVDRDDRHLVDRDDGRRTRAARVKDADDLGVSSATGATHHTSHAARVRDADDMGITTGLGRTQVGTRSSAHAGSTHSGNAHRLTEQNVAVTSGTGAVTAAGSSSAGAQASIGTTVSGGDQGGRSGGGHGHGRD